MAQAGSLPPLPVPVLTGSIGSGKTAASKAFSTLGVEIIDSDLIARELVLPGSTALAEIVEAFGSEVLLDDGHLNRAKLGERVFRNLSDKKILEKILHPRIRAVSEQRLEEALQKKRRALLVIPLFFESGLRFERVTHVIVVYAPEELCIERIKKRDGISEEFAREKFQTQLSPEEKVKRADFVIQNDGTLQELEEQVKAVAKRLWES